MGNDTTPNKVESPREVDEFMRGLEKKLKAPFRADEIEWRISRAGKKGDKVWATCLAYVSNRAIMNRLDEVFGIAGWKNEYVAWKGDSQLCGISAYLNWVWISKWDGAGDTDFESVKGGLSDSMKRAAVQWGIGRYLYNLDETFATVSDTGKFYQSANEKKGTPAFKWDPPALPAWALPADDTEEVKFAATVKLIDDAKSPKDCEFIRRKLNETTAFSEEHKKTLLLKIDTKVTELLSAPADPEANNG